MAKDSIGKTIGVTLALCAVCSLLVVASTIVLKPAQERNKLLATKGKILEAAGLLQENADVEQLFDQHITARFVDLETGRFNDQDTKGFDDRRAAKDPATSMAIPAEKDKAKIQRKAKLQKVYLVKEGEQIKTVILPVYGKGLWSTMYAFVALEGDANTVKGLVFYEHGETPGLGGEVENSLWKSQWPGKKLFDNDFNLQVEVLKGRVDKNRPDAIHKVDGLGGATLTTRGVTTLIRYWLGEEGFGPFLTNLRKGEANNV